MTTKTTETEKPKPTGLALLREPFPEHQISKLPKESKQQAEQRKSDRNSAINCRICGGWHHKNAVHLDYVGHAALTDRLLEADPNWTWEPMAVGPNGLPTMDALGGLWIRLTVCGVSRLGYGHADGKPGGNAIKEAIGDALRNAGMRFGAALDLWHKGDLHLDDEDEKPAPKPTATRTEAAPPPNDAPPPSEPPPPRTEPQRIAPSLLARMVADINAAVSEPVLREVFKVHFRGARAMGDTESMAELEQAKNQRKAALEEAASAAHAHEQQNQQAAQARSEEDDGLLF